MIKRPGDPAQLYAERQNSNLRMQMRRLTEPSAFLESCPIPRGFSLPGVEGMQVMMSFAFAKQFRSFCCFWLPK
jgi:hypothetical protein